MMRTCGRLGRAGGSVSSSRKGRGGAFDQDHVAGKDLVVVGDYRTGAVNTANNAFRNDG